MTSRRHFLAGSAGAIAATFTASDVQAVDAAAKSFSANFVSLCGDWLFRIDSADGGTAQHWYDHAAPDIVWRHVNVPHTWQIEAPLAEYYGVAWYRRTFDVAADWQTFAVRVEFEAVFHTATVWINGQLAGEHRGKGYTAFALDITHLLRWGLTNSIAVRVDNAFNQHMLPRGRSSDWAHDGGIFRPVQLLITPKTFLERVDVEATPNLPSGDARITITGYIRNSSQKDRSGSASYRIIDEASGLTVLAGTAKQTYSIEPGATQTQALNATLPSPKLWHFDHPNLYRLELSITGAGETHCFSTVFGVRKLEVKDGTFHLNGERVRLMGVERMAGSNPDFGMAETADWITHDHADLKHLNCIFTRVHWPQDKRVLDYCDRNGIFIQTEVPAWGPDTFQGMGPQPDATILENGLEQLREMIARDRNHPSIVVWGLCNEIGGQNPPAYQFAKRLLQEAKSLDPGRLCSYASNSLLTTPERDVAALMDFIEVNEYFGTWQPGSAEDAARSLDQIHAAFPAKPIVISEYGYCACTADRPEADERRMDILRAHDLAIRSKEYAAGAIFFCYNDYRTHVGDRGIGALKQRVHGVVDVNGAKKQSYELLRSESSPIESLVPERHLGAFQVTLKTRGDLPAYTLRGYTLRGTFYGQGNIPVQLNEMPIPELPPASLARLELKFTSLEAPIYVRFDVLRPTGFSAHSSEWKP
ncbi:MAG: glycoside hydrolase family 2 TIM barrel-domain containing protein [Candidatus Acidiferrum sp.]